MAPRAFPPPPRRSAVLIAGPTASGKSDLAMALAHAHDGVVINADSMQVYDTLRTLTARPTAADEAAVPHRLYGHVAATAHYSAGDWAREIAPVLDAVWDAAHLPIIVGGTGLYFRALTEGLSPVPPIPDEIRAKWRARASEVSAAELHRELAAADPEMAAVLRPSDPQRMARALEVREATGRSLLEWHAVPGEPVLRDAAVARLVLTAERDWLYARADARFLQMISDGEAQAEVAALRALDPPADAPVLGALGVAPLMALAAGALDLDEAISATQTATRRYIKRQLTWLRRNMTSWKTVDAQFNLSKTVAELKFFAD
ncbi:MAG: tRNA (adenosine(37)-N6)-dimethylallyltransferase MiaA [Pseudomonadota bacterium]